MAISTDSPAFDHAAEWAEVSDAAISVEAIARSARHMDPDQFEELRCLLNASVIIGRDVRQCASAGMEAA